jgi:restriction endonuclease, S subunit
MGTYKDSGIEWIGEIPNDWDVNKIKYTSTLHGRIGWQGLTSEEYIDEGPYLITGTDFQNGEIDWDSCVHISEERWAQADKIQIKDGDLLITKDGTVGKTAIVTNLNDKASLNSGVLLINLQTHSKKFLYWLLNSKVFWEWFDITNSGNSTILHLYQKDFDNFSFPIPPLQEQAAIADFLDKKNAEIDAITEKITQQIQTLKDYRHSLIIQIVTKGLDKTVAYKDSGIEWIGEIPQGWGKSDVKYLFEIISGATPESNNSEYWDGPINWITPADMNPTGPIKNGEKTITMLGYQSCGTTMIPENSIIISNRAPIGKINYNETELCTSQGCKGLINIKKNNILYFYYFFIAFTNQLKLLGRGTTFLELSTKDLGNFPLIVPPLQDQAAIADFLDDKTAKINRIIAKKEQQLDIIKEHRKSLIYEYVTGKKRVKEYQQDGN